MTQLADVIVCKTRFLSFFQQKSRYASCFYYFSTSHLYVSSPLLDPLPSHHCNLIFIHRNFLQLLGMIIAVLVAVTFAYVPGVEGVLGTKAIPGIEWLYMLPFSLFLFAQDELRKYLIRRNPQGITFPSPPFSSLLLPSPPSLCSYILYIFHHFYSHIIREHCTIHILVNGQK